MKTECTLFHGIYFFTRDLNKNLLKQNFQTLAKVTERKWNELGMWKWEGRKWVWAAKIIPKESHLNAQVFHKKVRAAVAARLVIRRRSYLRPLLLYWLTNGHSSLSLKHLLCNITDRINQERHLADTGRCSKHEKLLLIQLFSVNVQ